MRILLCLFMFSIVPIASAKADSSRVYNSSLSSSSSTAPYQDTSTPLYNGSASSGGGRPIFLNSMIRGDKLSSRRSRGSSYSKPYGMPSAKKTRRSAALYMTPAQVRAKQAADKVAHAKRQRQKEAARQARKESLKKNKSEVAKKSSSYKNRFQDSDEDDMPTVVSERQKIIYSRQKTQSIMPRKVFNSLN